MKTPRQSAFEILLKIHRDGAYSNLALDSELESRALDDSDKSFICALVYGTTERLLTIDYQLQRYLTQPIKKLKPEVLIALRLGAFQILFMDKIPTSAAVNESVKLTKNNSAAFASGLVNAVLRKIAANSLVLPSEDKGLYYYSIKYSCPEWILQKWADSYGEENAVEIAKESLGSPQTVLRVNTLKITSDELIKKLEEEGVCAKKSGIVENALITCKIGSLKALKAYREGLFHVQDIASQLCCKALDAKKGETILDICSAPGGKAFTTAQYLENNGKIVACDIYKNRLSLVESAAERLGIDIIQTLENDASIYNKDMDLFDKILCDVPCSGLGVIRRKPEIRFKKSGEVDKLPKIQYSIVTISAKYLKPGGLMIYSTCSLNPEENENIYNRFLKEHPDFEPVEVLPEIKRYSKTAPALTLMPHLHGSDGFFISAFRRRSTF